MRAIVIGAGPAGLASAACLGRAGIDALILDSAPALGSSWRGHYDRLALHTVRGRSGLPGRPFPRGAHRYPTKAEVIAYLEDYARHFRLAPRFGTTVRAVARADGIWRVETDKGAETAAAVVFATGLNGTPHRADWPGLAAFPGPVLHSSDYRNPAPFAGQRVLVVGFGNSGGDIALDLAEAGVRVDMAVRNPVNLLPKELFGIPITSFGLVRKVLPYKVAERLMMPLLRARIGPYDRYGLRQAAKGPVSQVIEDGRIPLIDVGTLAALRDGRITARRGPLRSAGRRVDFDGGASADYDAIILATGYTVDLRPILGPLPQVLDADGRPKVSGARTALPGLYFCSYKASADGQLWAMGREAEAIAADAARLAPEPAAG